MANPNGYVTVFESWVRTADGLDAERRLAFYDGIMHYSLYGQEPDFGGDVVLVPVFEMARPMLDKSRQARDDGARGGRPRKEAKNVKKRAVNSENHPKKPPFNPPSD